MESPRDRLLQIRMEARPLASTAHIAEGSEFGFSSAAVFFALSDCFTSDGFAHPFRTDEEEP
jgi:hypothetical protein